MVLLLMYYIGFAPDGGPMSTGGFSVKLGPCYSISKGVKGNKEWGTKTTTMSMMTTTKTKMRGDEATPIEAS